MVVYPSSSSSVHEEESRKLDPPASATSSSSAYEEESRNFDPPASAADHEGWTQQKLNVPMGYRFKPTAIELVLNYLLQKIMGLPLPADIIPQADVYRTDPEHLPIGKSQYWKEQEAYFFTCKYQNSQGERTHQAEPDGIWKADVRDKHIVYGGNIVGFKSKFVFHRVMRGIEEKTNWVMTEFRVHPRLIPDDTQAERLTVCRIRYDPERQNHEGRI